MEINALAGSHEFYENVFALNAVVSELFRAPLLARAIPGLLRAYHNHALTQVEAERGGHFLVLSHCRNHLMNIVQVVSSGRL